VEYLLLKFFGWQFRLIWRWGILFGWLTVPLRAALALRREGWRGRMGPRRAGGGAGGLRRAGGGVCLDTRRGA
jgi:hypothetical protein